MSGAAGGSPGGDGADRPPRRRSPLLARTPAVAVVSAALSAWLLWSLAPDVAYCLSTPIPIDLGGPAVYRLDRARLNRFVRIRGEFGDAVGVTVNRTGQPRTVGRVHGTNLLVDRPGRSGPPVYEGRLLPLADRTEYDPVVVALRARGAPIGEAWLVLRDGERPREHWLPLGGALLLLALLAINLRALLRALTA